MNWGLILEPIQFLQSPDYLMTIMIIISLWSSMGVGFLAMLAGVLNMIKHYMKQHILMGLEIELKKYFILQFHQ